MSESNTGFEEAAVFAEDLISRFFEGYSLPCIPSTGIKRSRNSLRKHYNENILRTVHFFSGLMTQPYYKASYFPRGYNALDFLHYCGRVAFNSLRDFKYGIEEAPDHAVNSIATYLKEVMSSGEFERNGGWSEIKEMSSKLCIWPVFSSVVCIGNKYGDFIRQNV